ncbi:MAG TPA: hypothetical protein VNW97_22595 [Candidatus Saccharimonadales bacterium]|nr:hypothetical protein [Candidatus Saccharimonadales bacterium]
MKRTIAVAGSLIVVAVALSLGIRLHLQHERNSPPKAASRFATRQERTIQLHPSGIRFQVPQDWLEWDSQFHNNFHLTREELQRVRTGAGEWDSEYGSVVNAALPFEHCAAHVGGEGWGVEGVSFGDLQMRAYVTDLSIREILESIQGPAFSQAEEIAKPEGGKTGSQAHISASRDKDWQRATITYPLWYGDYGGTAMVDFYMRDASPYRLVLVFMETGVRTDEKSSILDSVLLAAR